MSVRSKYEQLGVVRYYQEEGAHYTNPHFDQIRELLLQNRHRIDYSKVLDYCCGSGEVTRCLLEMGFDQTAASDPFTSAAFLEKTGRTCQSYSFEEVIKTGIPAQFSSIISSFAMHLCPEDQLFPLLYQLFQSTPNVVIITPHKRPVLEDLEGVQLLFEDSSLTERGKKVRLKSYTASFSCLEQE